MGEYVVVDVVKNTCRHFDLGPLKHEFRLDEDEVKSLQRGGLILPDRRSEIIKKEWLRFADHTRAAKILYGHMLEGYDVLTVGDLRSLTMLIAYVSTYSIPWPSDYETMKCFCVGHVDLYQTFEVKFYYVVGKSDG